MIFLVALCVCLILSSSIFIVYMGRQGGIPSLKFLDPGCTGKHATMRDGRRICNHFYPVHPKVAMYMEGKAFDVSPEQVKRDILRIDPTASIQMPGESKAKTPGMIILGEKGSSHMYVGRDGSLGVFAAHSDNTRILPSDANRYPTLH